MSAIVAGVVITICSNLILDYFYGEIGSYDNTAYENSVIENTSVPQLWSHHKLLDTDVSDCASNGLAILRSLQFTSIVRNENYVYGNFSNNRATIKCTELDGKTFVYTAVAGQDVEIVEKLRNRIAWQL